MDLLKVVSLILALVLTRPNLIDATEQANLTCADSCPPGSYRGATCNTSNPCKPCKQGSYTAIPNRLEKCLRCSTCGHGYRIIKPCTNTSDIVCECKKGEYTKSGECQKCSIKDFSNPDYLERCLPCKSSQCKANPNCICPQIANMTANTPATQRAASVSPKITMTASTTSPSPQPGTLTLPTPAVTKGPTVTEVPGISDTIFTWIPVVAAVVTFMLSFWFMLLFCRHRLRNEDALPCWTRKKDVERLPEDPKFNEQSSHHCSSPTQRFAISEETPMISVCQRPSVHINSHMQQVVHTDFGAMIKDKPGNIFVIWIEVASTDFRPFEHSDRWPAIVLYAIIKEVPLRRWKEFLRLLSVPDQQMERVELEITLGSIEKQYQMLRLWSQRSSSSMNDVYASLQHMDLSGCAQQLQENLEKLQWRPQAKLEVTV